MKSATPFIILAIATGLAGCQSGSHGLARLETASASPTASDSVVSRPDPVEASQQHELGNLDDFYRDKLGIDPRILYAQRGETARAPNGEARIMQASGHAGP